MENQTSSHGHGNKIENLILPNYEIDGFLGEGAFSVVKKAKDLKTGDVVAIKIVNYEELKNLKLEDQVDKEINILRSLVNDHVIRLYDVIETPKHMCLVMEYASNGDFFDYIVKNTKLVEAEARTFFQQLISGLEFCHENMVAHRDLKLENLLLDENLNLKLSDFGLSAIMKEDLLLSQSCGSPHYAAPEVLSDQPYLGPPVDVWSCGVILYCMLSGYYPFHEDNHASLYQTIKSGVYEIPPNTSSNVQDLLAGMLTVDPKLRLTIPEIRKHPWFQA